MFVLSGKGSPKRFKWKKYKEIAYQPKPFCAVMDGTLGGRSICHGRTYEAEHHEKIPWNMLSKADVLSMRQLPNWLRKALGLEERFSKGHEKRVPFAVEAALNEVLERLVAGPERDLQTAGKIKTANLLEVAKSLLATWTELHDEYCQEESAKPLRFAKSVDRFWVHRFLHHWCWSVQASNTRGAYLPYECKLMEDTCLQSGVFCNF